MFGISALITLWVIFVSFSSLFFIGLPFSLVLSCSKEKQDNTIWIAAPFFGLAVIVLLLQNLSYLGICIGISFFWLWIISLLMWVWLIKFRNVRLRVVFSIVPKGLFIAGSIVFLIHSLGLIIAGADYYVGRAWHDLFNYTAMAQFLVDFPLNTPLENLLNSPYALQGRYHVLIERMGQSIFHGFLAKSTFTDAKTTFESSILISPFLIVLAIFQLLQGLRLSFLSKKTVIIVSGIAGLLPSIAMLHLESFFSHALAIPLLLIWPYVVFQAIEYPHWKRIVAASLVLGAVSTIYTELYVIFIGLGIVITVCRFVCCRNNKAASLWSLLIVMLSAIIMNLGFINVLRTIISRITGSDVLSGIYPWAVSIEGLSRLWLGDLITKFPPFLQQSFGWISIFLLLLAFLGLGMLSWKKRDSYAIAIFVLAALPFALIIYGGGRGYYYQFYKLLLTISPLLPVGILIAINVIKERFHLHGLFFRTIYRSSMAALLILICSGIIDMTLRTGIGTTLEVIGRGGAHKLKVPSTKKVQTLLTNMHGQDLFLLWKDDFYGGGYMNGWLAYFARHNRVQIANHDFCDTTMDTYLSKNKKISPHSFIMIPPAPFSVIGSSANRVWTDDPYHLWKLSGVNWAILSEIANVNGLEQTPNGNYFFWMDDDRTQIKILAGRDGKAVLSGCLNPGPSIAATSKCNMVVQTNHGWEKNLEFELKGDDQIVITIPVFEGENVVNLRSLDKATVNELPSEANRPLRVQIRELRLKEFL